jgi:hypothetical protein
MVVVLKTMEVDMAQEFNRSFRIRYNGVEPTWLRIGGFGYGWDFRGVATVFQPHCTRSFIAAILAHVAAYDPDFDQSLITFESDDID